MKLFNKEKNTITAPFTFNYTELTAIEEYLTEQEQRGLRLKEIDGKSFVFEKAEPRTVRYCAEIYTGSFSVDFKATCENESWECVGVYNKELFVFRTENEDAVDIMTDDKEKMKIVGKRALLKPGNLFWFYYPIMQIVRFLMDFDGTNYVFIEINQSNPYYYLTISFLILILSFPLFILVDYFVWLCKAKTATKKGERIPFHNLKQANKKRKIRYVLLLILIAVIVRFNSFVDGGFAVNQVKLSRNIQFSGVIYWLFFVIAVSCVFLGSDSVVPEKIWQNKKKTVQCIVLSLCFLVLTVSVIDDNERKAEIINYNGAPITFKDFGYSGMLQDDRTTIKATRFAQQKRCNINLRKELPDESTDSVLMYEVFVSDFSDLREKYIEKVFEEHDIIKEEAEVIIGSETKWDVQYKVKTVDNAHIGMAVKDNTIVCTVMPFHADGYDFFEVAYEKLFPENE